MKSTLSYFVFVFGLIYTQLLYSQNSLEIDSLNQIISTTDNDSIKLSKYFEIYGLISFNDPEKAEKIIEKAFQVATESDDVRGKILCYDKWGGIQMNNASYEKALVYYHKADSLLQQVDWPRQQAVIYGNYAAIYKDMADYDNAILWNDKFIDVARELGNPVFQGFGLGIKGDIYQVKGQFSLAAKYHLESLKQYESANDQSRMGDAFLKLGQAHLAADRFEDAQINLTKAANIYLEINDLYFLSEAYSTLASMGIQQEDYDQSMNYFLKVDSLSVVLDSPYSLAEAIAGYEQVANGRGHYELALKHNHKALELYESIDDNYNATWEYIHQAKALFKLGQINEALEVNTKAKSLCESLNITSGLVAVHQNYSRIYKKDGQWEKAHKSLELYNLINDSLKNTKTQTQIEELQIIYDVQKKEQALEILEKEKNILTSKAQIDSLKRQRLIWIIALITIIALAIIYWLFSAKEKNKRLQAERDSRHQLELEKQAMEKQQLERELASYVLQLCQKNELLSSVKSKVASLAEDQKSENQSKLKSLERNIDFNIQNDENWGHFLSTFEKVHPDFLERLQANTERLTPSEQRLDCLCKMNLSSKQIASILSISPEGIKKARYRLRKKLKLNPQDNLQEYLAMA